MPSFTSRIRLSGLVLLLVTGLAAAMPSSSATATEPVAGGADRDRHSVVHAELARKMEGRPKTARVRVIVSLDVRRARTGPRPSDIRSARSAVVASLPHDSYRVRAEYDRIPAVSLSVNPLALDALARHPRVTAVSEDRRFTLSDAEANALTGVDQALSAGEDGEGVTVAVIDTGVDITDGEVHPGLADDLVGQACFVSECPGGTDVAEDEVGHGTHVAGIITGPNGVAPAAKVHALKVDTRGYLSYGAILSALDHVIGLNSETPGAVDLVNMSLSGITYGTVEGCDADNRAFADAFATLNSQGAAIFASTGNHRSTDGVADPACVTGAIGVGSVGDGVHREFHSGCIDDGEPDKVSCFSNTTPVQGEGELLDLLAPGCRIAAPYLDHGTESLCGTSMSAPYAAGVAALVLGQVKGNGGTLAPAELEALLEDTGAPITDHRFFSSPQYPRVDAESALGIRLVDPPSGLQLAAVEESRVALEWGPQPGSAFQVRRSTSDGRSAYLGSTPDTTFVDDDPPCGEVTYTVRASAGTATSVHSSPVSATARECPVPPIDVELVRTGPMSHLLRWSDQNSDETSVVLQRRRAHEAYSDHATLGSGTSFETEDTLTSCGPVYYRVVAVQDGDRSSPSPSVSRVVCVVQNDDVADAEPVTPGAAGTSTEDVEPYVPLATTELMDPVFSCKSDGPGTGHHSIWYTITPDTDTGVRITTEKTTLWHPSEGEPDTLLAVYRGTATAANEVACDDNGAWPRDSSLRVSLRAGETYLVQVAQRHQHPETATGDVTTRFTWFTPPPNDLWEAARVIMWAAGERYHVWSAEKATVRATDPAHPCRSGGAGVGSHTLWWKFTPEFSGTLDLDTRSSWNPGSYSDTVLSVWTGSPGDFAHVACNDNAETGRHSELTGVRVTAGTTYSVMVSRHASTPTTEFGTTALGVEFHRDPEVLVSPTDVAVTEDGVSDTYDVRLASEPTADVAVSPAGDEDCRAGPDTLTFTPGTWDQPQAVTVSAVNDRNEEGAHACTIVHTVTSDDPSYDGITVADVIGAVTDRPLVVGRPDGRIKKPGGVLTGNDVFGAARKQQVTASKRVGRMARFNITVQNDAEVAERLRVAGAGSARGYRVRYLDADGSNVTWKVVNNRLRTPVLRPGQAYRLTATVLVTRRANPDSRIRRTVTAISTKVPTATDTVAFRVRRR